MAVEAQRFTLMIVACPFAWLTKDRDALILAHIPAAIVGSRTPSSALIIVFKVPGRFTRTMPTVVHSLLAFKDPFMTPLLSAERQSWQAWAQTTIRFMSPSK